MRLGRSYSGKVTRHEMEPWTFSSNITATIIFFIDKDSRSHIGFLPKEALFRTTMAFLSLRCWRTQSLPSSELDANFSAWTAEPTRICVKGLVRPWLSGLLFGTWKSLHM